MTRISGRPAARLGHREGLDINAPQWSVIEGTGVPSSSRNHRHRLRRSGNVPTGVARIQVTLNGNLPEGAAFSGIGNLVYAENGATNLNGIFTRRTA